MGGSAVEPNPVPPEPISAPGTAALLRQAADRLDVVAIGVADERAVVRLAVLRPHARAVFHHPRGASDNGMSVIGVTFFAAAWRPAEPAPGRADPISWQGMRRRGSPVGCYTFL